MNKTLIFLLLLWTNNLFSQNIGTNKKGNDNCKNREVVFDYFRQQSESIVFTLGSVFLMPGDSISFERNQYCIDSSDKSLNIYFKNRLLYNYEIQDGKIEGSGYCYYPFKNTVAIQGTFKNSKLHGLVFVQNENGKMIEVMEFKNGIYVRHIYHWLSNTKKSLKRRSKNRSSNPLRGDEIITV